MISVIAVVVVVGSVIIKSAIIFARLTRLFVLVNTLLVAEVSFLVLHTEHFGPLSPRSRLSTCNTVQLLLVNFLCPVYQNEKVSFDRLEEPTKAHHQKTSERSKCVTKVL